MGSEVDKVINSFVSSVFLFSCSRHFGAIRPVFFSSFAGLAGMVLPADVALIQQHALTLSPSLYGHAARGKFTSVEEKRIKAVKKN